MRGFWAETETAALYVTTTTQIANRRRRMFGSLDLGKIPGRWLRYKCGPKCNGYHETGVTDVVRQSVTDVVTQDGITVSGMRSVYTFGGTASPCFCYEYQNKELTGGNYARNINLTDL